MNRLIVLFFSVILGATGLCQSAPIWDSSDVAIENRVELTDELFLTQISRGWTKLKQNTIDQKVGLGAFNFSKLPKRSRLKTETADDSTKHIYTIAGIGLRLDSSNNSLLRTALTADFSFRISDNIFEIRDITWNSEFFDRYIYGYLDSKNYLFIGTSPFPIDLTEEALATLSWKKFYQPQFSVYVDL